MSMTNQKRKFVFGLGTGCCGTASLAYLLNSQPGAFVGHELFPILKWSTSEESRLWFANNKWEQLNHESHLYDLVGDVGTYYLPYVRFLLHNLTTPLGEEVDFKFIVLRRDKEKVVEAFTEKFKRQNNNPLQTLVADSIRRDEWDDSFPKYDGVDTQEAIRCYYDDYYAEAEYLAENYPNHVSIYQTEDLNDEQKVREILDFVGVKNPNIVVGARKNKREDATQFTEEERR